MAAPAGRGLEGCSEALSTRADLVPGPSATTLLGSRRPEPGKIWRGCRLGKGSAQLLRRVSPGGTGKFFPPTVLSQDSGNCVVWGSFLLCPTPMLIGETGRQRCQARPTSWTTSSRRLKSLGLPRACRSHHRCRSSFLFAGMGARCYGDGRRCPLQVADTRPGPSLGLPYHCRSLSSSWAGRTIWSAIKGAIGGHCPGAWAKHPLSLPGLGNFPDSGQQEPGRAGGAGQSAWERHSLGVAGGT